MISNQKSRLLGEFSPTWIPDLILWFDYNFGRYQEITGASATTPANVGDPVGTWQARTGQYATAPSTGTRSTCASDGIQPDDSDDIYNISTISLTGNFTIYTSGFVISTYMWIPLGNDTDSTGLIRFTDNKFYSA